MITISKSTPDYFMSVAILLLEKSGTMSPFGRSYEDDRLRIRGNVDLTLVQVNADTKSIFREGSADELIGEFKDGVPTITNGHSAFTNHLEWRLSSAYKGEHVYEVVAEMAHGPKTVLVIAESLDDVSRVITDQGGKRDLIKLICVMPVPEDQRTMLVSGRVQNRRDVAAKIEESRDSTDSVYVFTCYDAVAGKARAFKSQPIQAVSLSEAEYTIREQHKDGELHFTQINVQTLFEYYSGLNAGYPMPNVLQSRSVKART
jgi:hypothetical protein